MEEIEIELLFVVDIMKIRGGEIMSSYSKVLVAVDGSESSENALRQALRICSASKGCELKALSVVHLPEDEIELMAAGIDEPAEEALEGAVKIAREQDIDIQTEVVRGFPCNAIVEASQTWKADLVVMGRRGRRRLERVLLGGVTERVIGSAESDVLVVPRNTEISFEKVCVATDGSEFGDATLVRALNFCEAYGGSLMPVSVVDVGFELMAFAPAHMDKMEQRAKGIIEEAGIRATAHGVKVEGKVLNGDPFREIVDFAAEDKSGVIFIGTHGRRGIRRVLMGSVAQRVIGHSPCPVIVSTV